MDQLSAARVAENAGRLAEAEQLYKQLWQRNPSPFIANPLGILLARQGRYQEAEALFRQAISMQNNYVPAYENLARCLRLRKDFVEAERVYRAILQLCPSEAANYDNVAWMIREQKRFKEAVPFMKKAVELQPGSADYHFHLGLLYNDLRDLENAAEVINQVLRIDPNHREARRERAVVLWRLNRFQDAMHEIDELLTVHPDYLDALQSRAELRLLLGDLQRGFKDYESRWVDPQFTEHAFIKKFRPNGFTKPVWKGEDLTGKTLLLYGEQGFGDVIQFIRYVPLVRQYGATCILQVPLPIKSLMEQVEGIDKVIIHGEKEPAYDCYISLMSLPALFGTALETIPAKIPYLRVPEKMRENWQRQLAEFKSDFKVGICWAGRPDHFNDTQRSTTLDQFAPLAKIPNIKFFALQKGTAAAQAQTPPPGMQLINLTHKLSDFLDTAAMIEQLDLVIAIDTVVVHMAGALGKPVWTLLPFTPEWRWMIDRFDSPWYSMMRLFRQSKQGDWAGIFAQVAQELRILVGSRA
ncbi:MAG TPA: tetratricopeptide repeat protein [Tepidisphaeraceae bacterium]|jgi:Flp pilus assembly protein TadD/ADP-heptose:LPS heptosyltransferase